jgi:ligand-binding sensor domain-containing protein
MKNKYFLFLFIFILSSTSLFSQQEYWYHLYKGDQVTKTIETENDFWIGTTIGLVRVNKLTDEQEIFNKSTSDLPNYHILNLIADQEGNIWIRTFLSISKYDGVSWTHFTSSNSILKLPESYTSLEVDNENRIWVTEIDRVLFFSNNEWVEVSTLPGISALYYPILIADVNGTVWMQATIFPSLENKIYRLEDNTWMDETQFLPSNITSSNVEFLGFDSLGNLWSRVGSLNGLLKKDNLSQNWTFIPMSTNFLTLGGFLTIDKNDNIWFSYDYLGDKKLVKFSEPNLWESIPFPNDLVDISITNAISDYNQGIWFPIFNNQTDRYSHLGRVENQNQITTIELPPFQYSYSMNLTQISDSIILMGGLGVHPLVFENGEFNYIEIGNSEIDTDGFNFFVGTNNQNKQYLTSVFSKKIFTYDFQDWESIDLPNKNLYLQLGEDEQLWASSSPYISEAKIYNYQNGIWDSLALQQSNVNLANIELDGFGKLWIQIQNQEIGILKYDGNIFTEYNNDNSSLCNNNIQIIGTDNEGEIWCNLQSCIQKFDSNTDDFEVIIDYDTLYHYFSNPYTVRGMVQMKNNQYYFKGSNSILNFDGTNFEIIDSTNSPFSNDIELYNIEKDTSDNLWIASSDGIFKYDGNEGWEIFNMTNSPLASHRYPSVSVDKENNIWMTCLRCGVYIYSENNLLLKSTEVKEKEEKIFSVYPNPFSKNTTISFHLEKEENVKVEVFDLNGRLVKNVFEGTKNQGIQNIEVSLDNNSSGVYFCRIIVGDKQNVLKLVFIE